MNRKFLRRRIIAGVVALLIGGSGTACTFGNDHQDVPGNETVATAPVGPGGGSYPQLNGVNVTVPAGAIQSETELTVSAPIKVPAAEAPFRLGTSTRVDISFKDGSQPAEGKPLEVQIPLAGTFKPMGANPNMALLYHRKPDGKGFSLVPAIISTDSLRAHLPHLSEWEVVYLDEATINSFAPPKTTPVSRDACTSTVETKEAGKVRVSGDGWSAKGDSPIHACLYTDGDKPALSIRNNMNYMMPVAATNGVKLNIPSKDTEEEMVRMITGKLFPDQRVKGYLGREAEATATLSASNLPATVELIGDPSTFLAESAWFALKFMVGMIQGKSGNNVIDDIKLVVSTADTLTCLQNTLKVSQGSTPSMQEVIELIAGKCTGPITEALEAVSDDNWWQKFWGRIGTFGDAVLGGWDTVWTAVDGIRLQFNGTIRVKVTRVATCPTNTEFKEVVAAEHKKRFQSDAKVKTKISTCQDGWVHGYTQSWLADANTWGDGIQTVMHWNGSRWEVVHLSGSDGLIMGEDKVCNQMPDPMRTKLCRDA